MASLLDISAEAAETTARSAISPHKRAFPRNEPVPTDGLRSQRILIRAPERVARQHTEAVRERGDVGRVGGVVALEVINEEAGADPLYRGERTVGPLEVSVRSLRVSAALRREKRRRGELTVGASSNLTCSERSASSDRLANTRGFQTHKSCLTRQLVHSDWRRESNVTSRLKLLPPTMLWTCGLQAEAHKVSSEPSCSHQQDARDLARRHDRVCAFDHQDILARTASGRQEVSFLVPGTGGIAGTHRRQNASTEPSAAKKAVAKR